MKFLCLKSRKSDAGSALGFVILFFISIGLSAQSNYEIRFSPKFNGNTVESIPFFESAIHADSIAIFDFRFYVHGVQMLCDGKEIWNSEQGHFLVDLKNPSSLLLELGLETKVNIDEIRFCIGVDSSMQMNGVHSGVLDPTNGMYWTWQSGYIHWKLEAELKYAKSRELITWHIGGYRAPFNTIRQVKIPLPEKSTNEVLVEIELSNLILKCCAEGACTIMSPSLQASRMADEFQSCFRGIEQ